MKPNYSLFLINQIGIAYRTPGHVNNTYLFKKKKTVKRKCKTNPMEKACQCADNMPQERCNQTDPFKQLIIKQHICSSANLFAEQTMCGAPVTPKKTNIILAGKLSLLSNTFLSLAGLCVYMKALYETWPRVRVMNERNLSQ